MNLLLRTARAAKPLLIATTVLSAPGMTLDSFAQQPLADDFEAPVIRAPWATVEQHGFVALATGPSRSGAQSLQLASMDGGQRNVWVEYTLPAATRGTISVWF